MPADYCGPFTIDDIDQFGTLEQINVSFDDASWASTSTCIYYTSGSVTANATVAANGYGIYSTSGLVNEICQVTCNGTVIDYNWANNTIGNETWTPTSASSNTWTNKTIGSEIWL